MVGSSVETTFLELRDLIAFLIPLLLGAWIFHALRRFFVSLRMKKVREKGRRGEENAIRALEGMGYRIIEEQVRREVVMEVNGEKRPYLIIGDLLVEKEGQTSIVEVKTGEKAPNPVMSATRRQLLEYATSFSVDSIKLYDGERGELLDIRFPDLTEKHGHIIKSSGGWLNGLGWFLGGVLVGAGILLGLSDG